MDIDDITPVTTADISYNSYNENDDELLKIIEKEARNSMNDINNNTNNNYDGTQQRSRRHLSSRSSSRSSTSSRSSNHDSMKAKKDLEKKRRSGNGSQQTTKTTTTTKRTSSRRSNFLGRGDRASSKALKEKLGNSGSSKNSFDKYQNSFSSNNTDGDISNNSSFSSLAGRGNNSSTGKELDLLESIIPEERSSAMFSIASTPGAVAVSCVNTSQLMTASQEMKPSNHSRVDAYSAQFEQPPTAFEAQLAIDDDEAYRIQAKQEAEQRFLSTVEEAKVLDPIQDKPLMRRKTWLLPCIVLCLVIVGAVIAVVVIVSSSSSSSSSNDNNNNSNRMNGETLAPTFPITLPPSLPPADLEFSRDICQDALPLDSTTEQRLIGSTSDATLDNYFERCSPSFQQESVSNGRGVWYTMEGQGQIMSFSTCDGASFDTQISVYTGDDCFQLSCVKANDQRSGCGNGDQSQIIFNAEEGTNYYVLVHGIRNSVGSFSLTMEEMQDNSECSMATVITDFDRTSRRGVSVFGTTERAPIHSNFDNCNDTPITASGVWYIFESTNVGFLQASVQDMASRISVYTGTSCDELICQTGDKDGTALWTTMSDTLYYILVHGQQPTGAQSNDFALTLQTGGSLRILDPPSNVVCDTATPLGIDPSIVTYGDTTNGAPALLVGSCGKNVFTSANGLWYSVLGTGTVLEASTCDSNSNSNDNNMFDTQISIFRGTCDALECIDGNDQSSCGDQSTVSWFSEIGEEYYILVHGANSRIGEFNLTIQESAIIGGDTCDNAVPIDIELDSSTLGTTGVNDLYHDIGACLDGEMAAPVVWYEVTGTGTALEASTCSNSIMNTQAHIAILSGECGNYNCVATNRIACNDNNQMTVIWDSDPGKKYFVLVYSSVGQSNNFMLRIDETPRNLECPSAQEISTAYGGLVQQGYMAFGTMMANNRADDECSTSSLGSWYKFHGKAGKQLTISACSPATNFEAKLSLFVGDDCSNNNLVCVDGNNGMSCGPDSALSWNMQDGETYYVLVQGADAQNFGNFALNIGPINNICDTATGPLVADGSVIIGSTVEATVDDTSLSCFASGITITDPGLWYHLEGDGTLLTATTCSDDDTNFDTKISIFSGTSCGELSCIAGNDNFCGIQSSVTWFASQGETYYILVHGYGTGQFGLRVNAAEHLSCDTSVGPIPTDGSLVQGILPPIITSDHQLSLCDATVSQNTIWYNFYGNGGLMNISACELSSPLLNDNELELSVMSNSGKDECVDLGCLESFNGNEKCFVTFQSDYGQRYELAIGSSSSDTMDNPISFSINSSNDECEDAFGPIPIGSTIYGSTIGATSDENVGSCGQSSNAGGGGVWYKIIGSGQTVTAFTCNPLTDFDTQLSVFSGECGGGAGGGSNEISSSLTCIGGKDNNCGIHTWLSWFAEAGVEYKLLVSGGQPTSYGNFVLTLA